MNSTPHHRRALACVLLVALLAACAAAWQLHMPQPAPKVLVVHSYGTDLPWVGDVDTGIDAALRNAGVTVSMRRHYMNLLNHPDCNHLREAAQEAQQAIDDWHPQVVLLVDDLAQALVGTSQLRASDGTAVPQPVRDVVARLTAGRCIGQRAAASTFATRAIFYAGVNGNIADYGYDRAANVTGVLEHKNLPALARLLQQINEVTQPPAVAVQLLNDQSSTAVAEDELYGRPHRSPLQWLQPVRVSTFADWREQVRLASRRGAMLLIANYQNLRDDDGRIVPADQVIAWTERHSLFPAVGAATSFVGDGGLVTAAMSGVEQGEVVAGMALHYLRTGELLPPQSGHRLLVGLQCALARKRHLEASSLYRRLRAELGARAMAVSEQVYLETDVKE
jgi:hypothetical protein